MSLPKKVRKHFSVASIAIALVASYGLMSQVVAGEDKLVLQITTKLGAQILVKVDESRVSSNLPRGWYIVLRELAVEYPRPFSPENPHKCYIVLEQGNGLFVLIPWQIFKSSVTSGTLQVVTIQDGTEYSGKLLTTVNSRSDAGLHKTYDLGSLNKIDLVSVQKETKDVRKSGQIWALRTNNPAAQHFEVLAPYFIFPYKLPYKKYSDPDIDNATDDYYCKTDAFYLRVNEEDISAYLSDFESVEFQGNDLMTVIGAGGQKTSGTILVTG